MNSAGVRTIKLTLSGRIMRSSFAVLFLVGIVFLATASFADNQPFKTKLDNGMTVIINELPSSPMVALYAWVNTGSAVEGKYLGSGVTHFVEHMLFKGHRVAARA